MGDSAGKRLASFRKSLGASQRAFAENLGVSSGLIGQIETEMMQPSRRFLENISNVYGISSDWLLNGHGEMLRAPGKGFKSRKVQIEPADTSRPNHGELSINGKDYAWVKRMGFSVSAGSGLVALPDEEEDGILLPVSWLERRSINPDFCFIISVRGESMAPAIPDGALVIIERQLEGVNRPGVYAFTLDGQCFIKRIVPSGIDRHGKPTTLMLISDNPAFSPYALTGAEMNGLKVAGKVKATINILED